MMFTNRFLVLFTFSVAIAGVSAQSFDECGQTCLNNTLSKGICSSINDTSCVCTSTQFQNTLATCLLTCSSSDLTVAQQLQNKTCSNVSTTSSTGSNASGTSPATSSSTTKSSGATTVEQLPLLSAIIVTAGALMGGAFAL